MPHTDSGDPRNRLLAAAIVCIAVAVVLIMLWLFPAHAGAAPLESVRIGCPAGQQLAWGYLIGPRFQPVEVLGCWAPRRAPRMGG